MRKERKTLKASVLSQNDGQISWLPKNPRQWTQTDIDRTANSINEDEDFQAAVSEYMALPSALGVATVSGKDLEPVLELKGPKVRKSRF